MHGCQYSLSRGKDFYKLRAKLDFHYRNIFGAFFMHSFDIIRLNHFLKSRLIPLSSFLVSDLLAIRYCYCLS